MLGSHRATLVVPGLFLVLATACRSKTEPSTDAASTGTLTHEAPADAADQSGRSASSPLVVHVAGKERIVLVHTPAGGAHGPRPLVLNLHGSGGTAAGQEAFAGMDSYADAHAFVVAYPQADIPLRDGFAWNIPGQPLRSGTPVPSDASNDVDFIQTAITTLGGLYDVDPKRVYLTGHSGGARMVSQLACELPTRLAGIAPVDGVRFPAPCKIPRPTPVIAFHGTADATNPYDGGGEAPWTYGVESAVGRWAANDGCAAPAATSRPAPGVVLTDYEACAESAAVRLYAVDGMGHEWPGGPPVTPALSARLGAQSDAINANAVMWEFFEAHRAP